MSESSTSIAAAPTICPRAQPRRRSRFFAVIAAIQLAIVLTGFAPTLYMRGYFQAPQLPQHLSFHGLVLTAWFALLLLQTGLVDRRMRWHRSLGWLGAAVAVGVVVTSALAAVRTLEHPRMQFPMELPQPLGAELLEQKSAGFFNTSALILIFTVLITAAVLQRHKPAVHKRLMLIASAAIVSAAAFRWTFLLAGLGVPADISFAIGGRAGIVVSLILIATVAIHDKLTLRRVLPATVWGAGVTVALYLLVFQLRSTHMALAWVAQVMRGAG